jgi:hypothetical protein
MEASSTPPAWLFPTLSLLGGLIGGVLGSFFSKRGEIRAIQRDLHLVLEQNRAMTQVQEEIRARISTDMWARQRKWEVKREVIFEALKELGSLQTVATVLVTTYRLTTGQERLSEIDKTRKAAKDDFMQAMVALRRWRVLTYVVCGDEARIKFAEVQKIASLVGSSALDESGNVEIGALNNVVNELVEIIRRELEQV